MLPGLQMILVIVVIGISTIVITILSLLLAAPVVGLNGVVEMMSSSGSVGLLRYFQITQAISIFIIPPIVAAFLFSKKPWQWLWFRKPNSRLVIISLFHLVALRMH